MQRNRVHCAKESFSFLLLTFNEMNNNFNLIINNVHQFGF